MNKEKPNSYSFDLITNLIIKNYFLFLVITVVFFTNGFFIFNLEKVFAESGNITQLTITTTSQSIDPNVQSSIITVQTQNTDGILEKVSETTHLILSSNSSTGKFYNANSDGCSNLLEAPFQLTMSSGSANKNFCYEDSTPGTHTLTISAEGKSWTPANQDIIINGEDQGGDSGDDDPTPASYTEITEDISADTTWKKENGPYVIDSEISILPDATLYIEKGVVVKFGNSGTLIVNGTIDAEGTSTEKIYFTSFLDDAVGGDTNGDGEVSYPYLGDWQYIFFDTTDDQSIFSNVVEKYSNSGLILYNGSSIEINNFESDNSILTFGSSSSFSFITIPSIELYNSSEISIENSNIMNQGSSVVSVYDSSKLDVKNSTIGSDYGYAISIFKNSSADFENVEVNAGNSYGTAISVYDSSSITFNNSSLSSDYSGFDVYTNSSLILNNSEIVCSYDCISVYDSSSLNLSGGSIAGLHDGVILFSEGNADISGATISDSLDAGVLVFNNSTSTINVTKSEITDNEYGFVVFDSMISIHENSIHDNFTYGAYTFVPIDLDFTSNYWGDKTGPTHSLNASGLGDSISENILFVPFLTTDPLLEEVRNPVILIPGITGTYLYKNYGDNGEIWPNVLKMISPFTDTYLNDLALTVYGTEDLEYPIKVGDIIRGISLSTFGSVHVFDGLIETLTQDGYVEGENLFVFPYDWRFSTEDTADLLNEKINNILNATGDSKVDIIAHSMGGLVAKKYIADNGSDKIDQLIFLGTPQLGAPKAFKALMFGDNMGYGINIKDAKNIGILSPIAVKYISQNMPSVYELLPSRKYVSENGNYVTNALDPNNYISLDYEQTEDLMIEKGRNLLMFPFADNLHNSVDDLDLSGIETHNFVGCGTKTIGEITVKQKRLWNSSFFNWYDDFDIKYINGDETVPIKSATKTIGANIHYFKNITHGSMPSAEGVKESVLAILNNKDLPESSNIINDVSACAIEGQVVSSHSPVALHIYDEEGNHVGPDLNGDIEYGIDGVQYDVIGEENYAFLPNGLNYKIVIEAKDTGGYNLKIEDEDKDDNITSIYNWTLVPLKALDSMGEIWIGSDYPQEEYSIRMDDDGDGDTDETYNEGYDGTEEAEKIVYGAQNHHTVRSGSVPNILNNFVIPRINKNFGDAGKENIFAVSRPEPENKEDIVKDDTDELPIEYNQDNPKENDMNYYKALVGESGARVSFVWPAITLLVVMLILLVKMFIKL